MHARYLLVALATFALCTSPLCAGTDASYRRVALTGDPAPGAPEGVSFARNFQNVTFNPIAVDAEGRVIFHAGLSAFEIGQSRSESGIWTEHNGTLQPMVITTDPAPGTDGFVFNQFFQIRGREGTGHVAFIALAGDRESSAIAGLWAADRNSLETVALSGDPAPGTDPPGSFDFFFASANIDASGRATINTNNGIWQESDAGIVPLALTGQRPPDRPRHSSGSLQAG